MTMYNTDETFICSDKPLNANINLVNVYKNDYIRLRQIPKSGNILPDFRSIPSSDHTGIGITLISKHPPFVCNNIKVRD